MGGKVSVIVDAGWETVTDKNSVKVTGIRGTDSAVTVLTCHQFNLKIIMLRKFNINLD